ncbi:MAG: hypothetical protein DMF72_19455 [Acidobacteria bacterium]|nr:MAG: hypothetical protein DMF72_19455 [Acidobacteriota bacterium]
MCGKALTPDRGLIAERAEPTPYTILVNFVDPVLAKKGFFATQNTGLDVKTVLEEAVGTEFELVDAKLGGATGKLWWFHNPTFVARLKEVPLSERVEQTVFRVLFERGRVTFTDVWDAVSREFPNSLTSDSTSIKEALETYARKVGSTGEWMLRDEIRQDIRAHPEIIALLAMIGKARGYDIWIGKNEQGSTAEGLAGSVRLSSLVTTRPKRLDAVVHLTDVLNMDLLWLKGNMVVTAFKVESTTTMTSGLQRGSSLPATTPKVMILPEDRLGDFGRKMLSPLFSEHFNGESWRLLFFDKFRDAFTKARAKTKIEDLFGVASEIASKGKHTKQTALPF